jgi:hypothetical protein
VLPQPPSPAPYLRLVSTPSADAAPIRAVSHAERVCPELRQRFAAEVARLEGVSGRLSLMRLLSFLGAGALLVTGVMESSTIALGLGALATIGFFVAVVLHSRVHVAIDGAAVRRDVHERHLARVSGRWMELPVAEARAPRTHGYAWDVDVVGPGSLLQRIDVTHTAHGGAILQSWLCAAASREAIAERQVAVRELVQAVELRQELEAAALSAEGGERLDGTPFQDFARLPSLFAKRPWLAPLIRLFPPITVGLLIAGQLDALPSTLWLVPLAVQLYLVGTTGRAARQAFDLVAARQGAVEAFERMLGVIERAKLDSPLLRSIQARLAVDGVPPSAHMRSLKSWSSSAELRQQALFYIWVNPLVLWDLQVLRGLEAWNARVGTRTADWFAAIGELEALCSLATLSFCDADAIMPELGPDASALQAQGLLHPLLPPEVRVGNDLSLMGPGSALIVTGSNMAGKSTLLRAVGLSVALALAGGPVCARALRLPPLRLRASMRAEDSLQRGASYFHAELQKLKTVVEDAEQTPPILFLLDELLRGTNARARHVGARAVLVHLLDRGATGLVATHDIALSAMEQERPGRVGNVHFTDVAVDGEMIFDYRLRPGVVRTSNALRLLAMAGIAVAVDDVLAVEGPAAEPARTAAKGVEAG